MRPVRQTTVIQPLRVICPLYLRRRGIRRGAFRCRCQSASHSHLVETVATVAFPRTCRGQCRYRKYLEHCRRQGPLHAPVPINLDGNPEIRSSLSTGAGVRGIADAAKAIALDGEAGTCHRHRQFGLMAASIQAVVRCIGVMPDA